MAAARHDCGTGTNDQLDGNDRQVAEGTSLPISLPHVLCLSNQNRQKQSLVLFLSITFSHGQKLFKLGPCSSPRAGQRVGADNSCRWSATARLQMLPLQTLRQSSSFNSVRGRLHLPGARFLVVTSIPYCLRDTALRDLGDVDSNKRATCGSAEDIAEQSAIAEGRNKKSTPIDKCL